MTRLIYLLCTILLAITVSANSEKVQFTYEPSRVQNTTHTSGRLSDISESLYNVFRSSHVQVVFPSFESEGHDYYQITGQPGRKYEVRVCWAASDPLNFQLDYLDESGLLKVRYLPEYYSHLTELRDKPLPAKYELVMNPMLFDILPSDIVVTIVQVIVGALGTFAVSGYLLRYI